MRRWLADARTSADEVADRATLWIPGALGWLASVGWLALVVGVAEPPSTAELTFFGARLVTSGLWPWNAIAIVGGAMAIVAAAFVTAASAEAVLLRGTAASLREVLRIAGLGVLCAVPAVIALLATGLVAPAIALTEFNSPSPGDPTMRTAIRLTPLLLAILATAAGGAAIHAAAARRVVAGMPLPDALGGAPAGLAAGGGAALIHVVVVQVARLAYLALAAVLMRVLWAPIASRLGIDGIAPDTALLLVGFVAIWLCLVLGGGALHAWGSRVWTRVLGVANPQGRRPDRQMETPSRP